MAAAVPVWSETQKLVVGAGFIPPAGPCGEAGCAGRCKHRSTKRLPPCGPMRASSPTGVTAMRGSRLTAVFPWLCRAGVHARRTAAIQNRGVRGGGRSGGMRASRPTSARWGAAVPVWPETQNLFVGAGFIPPAKPCGGAWPPGRSPALRTGPAVFGLRNVPAGAVQASSRKAPPAPRADASIGPYRGLWCGKAVISRLAAVPAAGRRGGFHIRPGCSRRREARRDEGIPPYVRPDGEDQPF